MHPLFLLPALFQTAPAPAPPGLHLPPELRMKAGTASFRSFDRSEFELSGGGRTAVEGRTWRCALEAASGRRGPSTLLQWLKPALLEAGWTWVWEQRGIARRQGFGPEAWLRVAASGSGELGLMVVERGEPRHLRVPKPGARPEPPPAPDGDFVFLPPWPGAVLMRSADSPAPVPLALPDGQQTLRAVNFIEKEYALPEAVSAAEFVAAYRRALETAGWEIEGNFRGALIQIQAIYQKEGRDLRATLRLAEGAMAISVADVGAQMPRR